MFHVLDQMTVGKEGAEKDHLNEDGFVITDDWVAVFDGETDKRGCPSPTPGREAVQALQDAIQYLDKAASAEEAVRYLHNVVGHASNESDYRPAAVAALLNVDRREIISVGDIWIGIDGNFHQTRNLVDEVAATVRSMYMKTLIEKHGFVAVESLLEDPGRRIVLPVLQQSVVWRNNSSSDLGFPTIDGTETPMDMVEVFNVTAGSEVVFATDGYCDPRENLEESESVLAHSLQNDPLRIGEHAATKPKYPWSASFDDRTYVRFKV